MRILYTAGHLHCVMHSCYELFHQALGISLSVKRNCTEDSITSTFKRPDFLLLVGNTMMMKGEEKTDAKHLSAAVGELGSKMKEWSHAYHGKVW
jgi:hypothetical protein